MRTVSVLVVIVVLFAVGCSGTPAGTPIVIYVTPPPGSPVTPQSTDAARAPTAQATSLATAPAQTTQAPTTPAATKRPSLAPRPTSNAAKGDPVLLTWSSSGYVTAQVIVPVVNQGGTWIELDPYGSQFTIFDVGGSVTESSSFDTAAPTLLAPGATAYMVGETFGDDHPRSAYDRVEVDVYYGEAREPEGSLTVENTTLRRASYGDGVEVTGQVRNGGPEKVENATVVAIFMDGNGDLIGFASGYVENVEPGGSRSFEIDSSFAEIRLSDIQDTKFFADDWGF